MQNVYNRDGTFLVPFVVKASPNYKNIVGQYIFNYVERIFKSEQAYKITGMLTDLPLPEILEYLKDYSKLEQKVNEA